MSVTPNWGVCRLALSKIDSDSKSGLKGLRVYLHGLESIRVYL